MAFKTLKVLLSLALVGVITKSHAGDISSSLINKINSHGNADAVLELPSIMSSVLSDPILNMMMGAAKTNYMTGLMKQMTTAAQAPFISALQMIGVENVQPFWISNKISMKSIGLPVINAFRAFPGAFTIREPIHAKLIEPAKGNSSTRSVKASGVQWGVSKIGADSVWSKTNGDGIIVANIDTGVAANHEALKDNYAGFFHDAISHKKTPYDDNGHGTHTMGTICGTKNGIGVAPGAKWVACKGLGEYGGDDVTLSECAQWILDLDETPTVVCNSWGGGQGNTFFNDEIKAWQAAGIVPVFAIGNEGPRCGTASSPGDQPNVISVGATTNRDQMARFSSRGPSKQKLMKPEVSGPGQDILSAWPDGGYETLSGTSMATPHVTGAVALMRAADPDITFKEILKSLEDTAERPTPANADLQCGRQTNRQPYPNNAYGYGRINVKKAMA